MKFPKFPVLSLFFPIERAPAPIPKVVKKHWAGHESRPEITKPVGLKFNMFKVVNLWFRHPPLGIFK
jgi:hypothetical protein